MATSLIKRIVLVAGAWKLSDGTCIDSEEQFERLLEELKRKESLSHEEAVQMVMKEVS